MTEDRRKKRSAKPPEPSGAESANDRPTVNPPFDVEAFARLASGPSSQQRSSPAAEAPTRRPPPPPDTLPPVEGGEVRERQITRTNEAELEAARLESSTHSDPPGPGRASPLSIADARASSSPSMPPVTPGRSITPTSIEAAVLGAIGASSPEITERTIDNPTAEMRERFSLGDYTGALEMSELILAEEPSDLEAAECGENCRTVLEQMYAARLGPLDRIPMVVVPRTQMRWLSMDHRAGFILSLIDGSSSVDLILDVGGMPRLDALRILHELVRQRIVAFR
jgi:hypothetical protein